MAIETEVVKIQLRRGTSLQWFTNNPILSPGEFGYETDTGNCKAGNGTTPYRELPYINDDLCSIKAYTTTITYKLDDLVTFVDEGKVKMYRSMVNNNIGNPLDDKTKWDPVSLGGKGSGLPLLTFLESDHKITDMSFVDISTFNWLDKDMYPEAYAHLLADYEEAMSLQLYGWYNASGSPNTIYTDAPTGLIMGDEVFNSGGSKIGQLQGTGTNLVVYNDLNYTRDASLDKTAGARTETIGNYTITYYQSADEHKICLPSEEADLQGLYGATGVAWYYMLDTINERFRVPRTKWGFVGKRTHVGDYIDESLPVPAHTHTRGDMEISGSYYASTSNNDAGRTPITSGALKQGPVSSSKYSDGATRSPSLAGTYSSPLILQASDGWTGNTSQPVGISSPYKTLAPVQQRATQVYIYCYVGGYTQEAIEQAAGLNAQMITELQNQVASLQSQLASRPYIKQAIPTSTGGYVVWSNGYYEEWGNVNQTVNPQTITLSKTMKNTNYVVLFTAYDVDDNAHVISIAYRNKTTTTISFVSGYSGTFYPGIQNWKVSGFLADGQY